MGKTKYSAEQACQIAADANYLPEETYPGRTSAIWCVRCMICSRPRKVTLGNIIQRRGICKHQRTIAARAVVRDLPVAKIVKKYKTKGLTIRALAEEYGVSFGTIQRIVSSNVTPRSCGRKPATIVRDQSGP